MVLGYRIVYRTGSYGVYYILYTLSKFFKESGEMLRGTVPIAVIGKSHDRDVRVWVVLRNFALA